MSMPILNKLSKEVQLNSLFLQPTYWCAINCSGCYVKERNIGKKIVSIELREWVQFIQMVLMGHDIRVNELTISMDDLSKVNNEYSYMRAIFEATISCLNRYECEHMPKVNMTFHTIPTYLKYLGYYIKNLDQDWKDYLLSDANLNTEEEMISRIVRVIENLNMISFSSLNFNETTNKILEEIRNETLVNYNLLIPRGANVSNIDKHFKHLIEASKNVDHIYLVIKKDPIGKARSQITKEKSEENMRNDLYYINHMNSYLPKRILNKIDIDGCLRDIKKYNKTGYGCSSNISKIQVWPDGKVTGCAYAVEPESPQRFALRATDIIQNIRVAQKRYDFEDAPCHLVDDYNNCLKKSASPQLNRFLNIL